VASALALAGCYGSHPGGESPAARDAAVLPDAAASACEHVVDGCQPSANEACVRFHDRAIARMDAVADIATGVLGIELITPGALHLSGCERSYDDGVADSIQVFYGRERTLGTRSIESGSECDPAGCVTAWVARSQRAGTGGSEAWGTITFSAIEERAGGRVCAAFTLTDEDGLEIARGAFNASLTICDL
jgi:hypothetical protein